MGFIYMIKNKVNGKVYIGLTTNTIEERWKQHLSSVNFVKRHLYYSIKKYGVENFSIYELDKTEDFKKLGELERYYIKKYKSTNSEYGYNITHGGESNQLDANPRAKLTEDDVIKIRELYNECTIGCKDCWELFKHTGISYSAFEKVYEGNTWKSVMPHVYTNENKEKHQKFKGKYGFKNSNSRLTDEEVMEIRKYYVNHTLNECYEKYGEKYKSKDGFRSIIKTTYTHLPIYRKDIKKWI